VADANVDPEPALGARAEITLIAESVLVFRRTTPERGSWRLQRATKGGF
jgi:hypothetical protein